MTTDALVTRFLEAKEPNLARGTAFNYSNCWKRLRPVLGDIRLQALMHVDVCGAYSSLQKKGFAYSTVYGHHIMLNAALNWAVRSNFISKNPATGALKERRQPKTDVWTNADWANFVARSGGDPFLPLWTLVRETALRRGEALALRWRDVDFERARLAIGRQLKEVPNRTGVRQKVQLEFQPPKSSSGMRSIALLDETVELLRSVQQEQRLTRETLGLGWSDDDLVFAHADGRPHRPSTITMAFIARVKRLGMPKLSLHGLRRSLGAEAMRAGTHPKVLSQLLGHSREAFTMLMYQPFTPGVADDAVRSLVRSMRPSVDPTLGTADRARTPLEVAAPGSQVVHMDDSE
jgi:integrase